MENLQWLFTGTLLGMLVINPPFAALVARLPRVKFIAVIYRFFLANLIGIVAGPVLLAGKSRANPTDAILHGAAWDVIASRLRGVRL